MGLLKPESLVWADQIENLKSQTPVERRIELKKTYDLSSSQITSLLAIKACFDPSAFDKVRQAQKSNPPFTLSFSSAQALSNLKNRIIAKDLSKTVHAALDVILAKKLSTKKIKALVVWMISGKPASEFDPKAKPPKKGIKKDKIEEEKGEDKNDNPDKTNLDLKKLRQLLEKAEAERIQGNEITEQDKLVAYLRKVFGSSPSKTDKDAPLAGEGMSETILLDWLADINVIKKLQTKRKKGKSLSAGEWWLLAGHRCLKMAGHGLKLLLKLFKPFIQIVHWVWKLVIEALKELGVYKFAKAIFTLVAVVAALWFAWEAFHYGLIRPMELAWSKIHFQHAVTEEAPTPVPTPSSTTSPLQTVSHWFPERKAEKPTLASPAVTYQPAVSFQPAQYNSKLLEFEIGSIESNSHVNDFAVTIDEGMPLDVAVSRMQGVADPDKYTMMIGSGKQIVSLINTTTTGLEIHYKSADPFGVFLNGDGKIAVTWEDARVIHVNEIDIQGKTPTTIYQFTLIAAGEKFPLTLQCASPDDLEHLVSTMEYFIRHSRLDHDIPLGGMPYPSQGLVFNNQCVVEKSWVKSPADKAGIGLGDHLWSVGKITSDPEEKKDFEKGLSMLPAIVFVASDADWDKATIAKNSGMTATFRPKLRKVSLQL